MPRRRWPTSRRSPDRRHGRGSSRAIEAAESDGATGVVIEAIRLLDRGLATVCDEVWLVTCAPEVQVDRLAGRGTDPEDAARRIEAQAGLVERVRPAATRVIDTSWIDERQYIHIETAFDAALRT